MLDYASSREVIMRLLDSSKEKTNPKKTANRRSKAHRYSLSRFASPGINIDILDISCNSCTIIFCNGPLPTKDATEIKASIAELEPK